MSGGASAQASDLNPQAAVEAPAAVPAATYAAPTSVEDLHLDDLLRLVVEKKGSDLHLAVGIPPVIRVDGALLATNYGPMTDFHIQRMVYAVLTDEQIRHYETTLELDCSYQLRNVSRFRVNIFRERGNVAGRSEERR